MVQTSSKRKMKKLKGILEEIAVTFLAFCGGVFLTSLVFSLIEAMLIDLVDAYVYAVTLFVGLVCAIAGNVFYDWHKDIEQRGA